MKSALLMLTLWTVIASHPSRGGWIEIIKLRNRVGIVKSPTPHGVGGLKSNAKVKGITGKEVPPLTGWVD